MSIAKKPPLRLTSLVECLVLFVEGIGFYQCRSILLWSQSRPTRMKRLCTRHTSMAHVWCPWEGNVSWIDGSSVRWGHRPIARTYRQFENCVRMLWSPSVHPLLRSPASFKATTIYVMKTRSLLHENPDALSCPESSSCVNPQERKASLAGDCSINLTTSFAGFANSASRYSQQWDCGLVGPT